MALPEPRPLFNLDQLAGRPDAPVLVVEGEGKAGHAARIFPDRVSTTSPGGAGAFGKADWTPLAGRNWSYGQTMTSPGATYARGVAEAALKVGARSVRIVQVPAHFDNKWDLAKSASVKRPSAWPGVGMARNRVPALAGPRFRPPR